MSKESGSGERANEFLNSEIRRVFGELADASIQTSIIDAVGKPYHGWAYKMVMFTGINADAMAIELRKVTEMAGESANLRFTPSKQLSEAVAVISPTEAQMLQSATNIKAKFVVKQKAPEVQDNIGHLVENRPESLALGEVAKLAANEAAKQNPQNVMAQARANAGTVQKETAEKEESPLKGRKQQRRSNIVMRSASEVGPGGRLKPRDEGLGR